MFTKKRQAPPVEMQPAGHIHTVKSAAYPNISSQRVTTAKGRWVGGTVWYKGKIVLAKGIQW